MSTYVTSGRRRGTRLAALALATVLSAGAAMLPTALSAVAAPADIAPAAAPAVAAPADTGPATQPATADEAKLAWLDAVQQQRSYGERVKGAQYALDAAKLKAAKAGVDLAKANAQLAAMRPRLAAAEQTVQRYQAELDAFTGASLRGAPLSPLSALLSAGNADDFIDRSIIVDRIAGDNAKMLADAAAAKAAVVRQQQQVAAAATAAAVSKRAADQAAAEATAARAAVDTGKVELAARIRTYQVAFAQLSAADRADPGANMEQYYAAEAAKGTTGVQAFAKGSVEDPTSAAFAARAAKEAPTPQAGIAVLAALSRQGLPYIYATDGPNTFDCSGLTKWAWAKAGVSIPPVSYQQVNLPEVPLDQLQPGDLVTYYSPVSHVGMYVGHGKVVHAAIEGVPIKVVDLHAAGPNPSGHRPQY